MTDISRPSKETGVSVTAEDYNDIKEKVNSKYDKTDAASAAQVQALDITDATELTAAQMVKSVICCGVIVTHVLPSPAAESDAKVVPLGTYVVTLEPGDTDIIWLDGVALDAGVNIVSDGACSPCYLTIKSAGNWLALTGGLWTEGT